MRRSRRQEDPHEQDHAFRRRDRGLHRRGILATGASATSQRHDAYYQVWCYTPEGGEPVQAESVDAHSVQFAKTPGGKDGAVLNFVANHEGWDCWLVGPLNV